MTDPVEIMADIDDTVLSQADRYVWSLSGDGMSTSPGVRTRERIRRAWLDGYQTALRSAPTYGDKG